MLLYHTKKYIKQLSLVRQEYLLSLFINENKNKNKSLIPGHKLSYIYRDKIGSPQKQVLKLIWKEKGLAHCGNAIQTKWLNSSLGAILHCALFKDSTQGKKDLRGKEHNLGINGNFRYVNHSWADHAMYITWAIFFLSLSYSLIEKNTTWNNEKGAPLFTFCHLLTINERN